MNDTLSATISISWIASFNVEIGIEIFTGYSICGCAGVSYSKSMSFTLNVFLIAPSKVIMRLPASTVNSITSSDLDLLSTFINSSVSKFNLIGLSHS